MEDAFEKHQKQSIFFSGLVSLSKKVEVNSKAVFASSLKWVNLQRQPFLVSKDVDLE